MTSIIPDVVANDHLYESDDAILCLFDELCRFMRKICNFDESEAPYSECWRYRFPSNQDRLCV